MTLPVNDHAPDGIEEHVLLERARAGDADAFARLYDRHAPVVLSLCRRGLSEMTEAEDATQETFIRAFRKLDELADDTKFRPWLYGFARHVCSERRRSRRRRTKYEAQAMTIARHTHAPPPPASDSVEFADTMARLSRAIEALEPRERLAIHLYYLDHDPVAAARSALGLSRSGYYKLLSRARASLAGALPEVQPS